MDVELRTLTPDDADAFLRVDGAAFSEAPSAHDREQAVATTEWDRTVGAFEGADLCGAAAHYGVDVTLPGLVTAPTAGVTAVGVLPTHRRRGILTGLMAHQLQEVADRGEAFSILNASEATIYRRFGYGIASSYRWVEVDRARSAFATRVPDGLPLRLLEREEAVASAPAWHDAHRRSCPGEISRPASWWPVIFGEHETWKGGGPQFVVGCEPADGRPGGYARYKVDRSKMAGQWTMKVHEVVAGETDVAAALWRYLLDVDLVDTVTAEVAVDDALRWRLADWRALRVTRENDFLWVRVLDPVATLAARRYGIEASMVIEIDDPFRPATSGRYRVSGGPDGAVAESTDAAPDLVMDVAELGSLYLGGFTASGLARAGRIVAANGDALTRADLFFASPGGRQPFCSTHF